MNMIFDRLILSVPTKRERINGDTLGIIPGFSILKKKSKLKKNERRKYDGN